MDRNTRLLSLCFAVQACLEILVCATAYSQSSANRTLLSNAQPEAGPWGPWTESSQCSRTCGGGVTHQDRICMDTRPDGRHSCTGAHRRYFSCNVQDCPQGSRDFRALQCARFNTVPHKGVHYSWEPYHHPAYPCELFCSAGSTFKKTDSKVIDGTKCRDDGSPDICVDGQCMPVGCDNVLGSTQREDQCRVCGGDGSSCSVISGVFDENQLDVGYNDILLIPAGATAIFIEKTKPSKNFLAVRNAEGRYYLNGQWKIEFPRQLVFAGTVFHYERRQNGPELLTANGPTAEALFVVLLYQEANSGIEYKYAVSAPAQTNSYEWTSGDFEPCSQSCGEGVRGRPVRCVRTSDRQAADERLCDPTLRPGPQETCNSQPCPADWQIGEWNECSAPCGGGSQFRVVYCQQTKEGSPALVPDETCQDPKPLFMRSCNLDKECPEWEAGEWSTCDSACGEGHQNRSVDCPPGGCDPQKRPEDRRNCTLGPCEGVEWIVSEWSGCDGSCSPRMESRGVHCANEEGGVFPDSACDAAKMPELARPCPESDMCEPMWHASQWTQCSAVCGKGVQSRVVFCGAWQDDAVIRIDEEKCEPADKFEQVRECSAEQPCKGTWFTGPWNRCSVACGGGERTRKILCFHEDEAVDSGECDLNEQPDDIENCNMEPCDDDEMMRVGGCEYGACANTSNANVSCEETEFGCCADGITPALGPFKKGCATNCTDSKHGCCPDGLTAATGPGMEGCANCENATHGCCPDGLTPASGPDLEGCPANCSNSTHGCCPDGLTAATGPGSEGCPDCSSNSTNVTGCGGERTGGSGLDIDIESSGEDCYGLQFGCCPDGLSPALGPGQEGCEEVENGTDCGRSAFGCCDDGRTAAEDPLKGNCMDFESSGDGDVPCVESTFGCCPDNETHARGFDLEGCDGCMNSTFGCCPDNVTAASGPDGGGCNVTIECAESFFGCCPDNISMAVGPDFEGCEDCLSSDHGCCPDNLTIALGPDFEGCNVTIDCANSSFGCCPDNLTVAQGLDFEGCNETIDCANSSFGCCPDNLTIALGPDFEGCNVTIDCANSSFGCCPDNLTVALGMDFEGCNETIDCANSSFSCCPDNLTAALGPDFEGCNVTIDCANASFGCCPDNLTVAQGPDFEGCNVTALAECVNTQFGCCPDEITTALGSNLEGCCFGLRFACCPDNKTAALGPTFLGCGCQTYPFGCCPDNITPAQGPNYVGCRCEHTRHGCCPDQVTPAKGPAHQGCECQFLYYGCCPDGVTPARGERLEGCGCDATRYGCCPDGRTAATSADLSGCPCSTLPFGCCPDGHTPARTPDLWDCPCESQRYGCCADRRTAARGPGFEGCPCETTPFGCCADNYTPAKGPRLEGCPDVLVPKPKVSTEVCSLPKEPGPCRNYAIKWFFDLGYGGCSRFWYGGCDGNGNIFATQEECESACVKPEGPEACLLPMVRGSCEGKVLSWYFDAGSKTCETFTYGGCLGNSNRFATRTDCVEKCLNNNNQPNEVCPEVVCPEGSTVDRSAKPCPICVPSSCVLPQEVGPCTDFRERWYFEAGIGECNRFFYGGCKGNDNNFGSLNECEKRCGRDDTPEQPSEFKTEYCFQLQDAGPCSSAEANWYYDSKDGVCKEFNYGGCKGNRNRFETRKECEKSCFKAQDVCTLPAVKGACSGDFAQWYYDAARDECFEFAFSGCQGNGNRFDDRQACQQRCQKTPATTTTTPKAAAADACSLPKDPGPCQGSYRSWYFDASEKACKSFIYGGCGGNDNRFAKRRECEQRCGKKVAKDARPPLPDRPQKPANEDVCRLPVDAGPCRDDHPRWFYDAQTQSCLPFVYGGCGGNQNRFKTAHICLRFCGKVKSGECGPSNCSGLQCPYGIEETFDAHGCSSSCRCSSPCEVHTCPEGSRCVVDVVRTSRDAVRTEPICRRVEKSGACPPPLGAPQDCDRVCRDDADCPGEHKCCNSGCACLPPQDETFDEAKRPAPATILPGVNVTRGEVGRPSELPCNAVGWPRPTVTWWRDTTMLPLSSTRYSQLPDYALLIRSVVYEDGGEYSCHAHNGIGSGATYKVTLIVDFAPLATQSDAVPVSSAVALLTPSPTAGSPLQVECTARGPPGTQITWQLGDTPLIGDDRRTILANHTLFIARADVSDSGEYRCVARHHHDVATSSIHVQVAALPTESSCVDNPQFKNCNLIVSAKYCNNKIYGKYCCASCVRAGQLVDMA